MKGVRFYEEFGLNGSLGNIVAIFHENGTFFSQCDIKGKKTACYDGMAGLYNDEPNSPVASSAIAFEYLQEDCKRVNEKRAREIHPKMFERLDD